MIFLSFCLQWITCLSLFLSSKFFTWVEGWEASTKGRKTNKAPEKWATCPAATRPTLVPPAAAEKRIITKRITTWEKSREMTGGYPSGWTNFGEAPASLYWNNKTYQKSLRMGLCHRRTPWRHLLGCGMWMVRWNGLRCGNGPLKHHVNKSHLNSRNLD